MTPRPARPADAEALAALDARCNPGPWSAASFAAHIAASPPNATLVVEAHGDGGLSAFCAFRVAAADLEILQLGTAPEARRRGLARALLARVLEQGQGEGAEVAWLEVRSANDAARALYAAAGFEPCGVRPRYYHDPADDAIVLRRVVGAGLEMSRRPVLASQRIDGLTSECGPVEVEMTSQAEASSQELLDNEEYRRLADEHHTLDARLLVLSDKLVLSDEEQLEEATLKKKKLQLKDRMESISREVRNRAH